MAPPSKVSDAEIIRVIDEYVRSYQRRPTLGRIKHQLAKRKLYVGDSRILRLIAEWQKRGESGGSKATAAAELKNQGKPALEGPTPSDLAPDPELAFRLALAAQRQREALQDKRRRARISFPPEPVALVFLSDLHFGSPGTDYRAAREDAELIARTPGMWAIFHGDGIDNFVASTLAHARRGAPVTLAQEWALLRGWLEWLGGKLLATVSGNHDAWTQKLAGVDYLQNLLPPHVLYDPAELVLTLEVGRARWRVLIRHKTRYNSIYNALHGIKQTVRLGQHDADIAVAGHVHRGAVYEPWYMHGKRRLAILTGAYKVDDDYAREEGFLGGGKGTAVAVVFWPDGRMQPFDDLRVAAEFMRWLRSAAS